MSHEQSDTIQGRDGRWYNIYGQGTGATQPMPLPQVFGFEKPSYATESEASNKAAWRSVMGEGQYPTSAPQYGFTDTYQPSPQAQALGRVIDALRDPKSYYTTVETPLGKQPLILDPLLGSIHPLNVRRTGKSIHDVLSGAAKKEWLERAMRLNAQFRDTHRQAGLYEGITNARRGIFDESKTSNVSDERAVRALQQPFEEGFTPFVRSYVKANLSTDPLHPIQALKDARAGYWNTPTWTDPERAAFVEWYDTSHPIELRRLLTDEKYQELKDWSTQTLKKDK